MKEFTIAPVVESKQDEMKAQLDAGRSSGYVPTPLGFPPKFTEQHE